MKMQMKERKEKEHSIIHN